MTDIALDYQTSRGVIDFTLDCGDLLTDSGLETAVLMSLYTDARAREDDQIPDGSNNKRGWWGSQFLSNNTSQFGSRLWLLEREKQLNSVLQRAEEYAIEALQWMIDDGVASDIQVQASIVRASTLGLEVIVTRTGQEQGPWQSFWEYQVNGRAPCVEGELSGNAAMLNFNAYQPLTFSPAGQTDVMPVQAYRIDSPYLPMSISLGGSSDELMGIQTESLNDNYRPMSLDSANEADRNMPIQSGMDNDSYANTQIVNGNTADDVMETLDVSTPRFDTFDPSTFIFNGIVGVNHVSNYFNVQSRDIGEANGLIGLNDIRSIDTEHDIGVMEGLNGLNDTRNILAPHDTGNVEGLSGLNDLRNIPDNNDIGTPPNISGNNHASLVSEDQGTGDSPSISGINSTGNVSSASDTGTSPTLSGTNNIGSVDDASDVTE